MKLAPEFWLAIQALQYCRIVASQNGTVTEGNVTLAVAIQIWGYKRCHDFMEFAANVRDS